jgi:capsular exopolysaccharide synthesis family protein
MMEEYEKKQELPVLSEVVEYTDRQNEPETTPSDLLMSVLRRWHIVLFTFLIVAGTGIAMVHFFMGKKYETKGMIRVSPVETPIMYETEGRLPPYDTFKNTQATLIKDDVVLNRAADELKDKNLIFFEKTGDILHALKTMAAGGRIQIEPDRKSEFIHIRMITDFPRQAEQVIDAVIRGYMSVVVSEEIRGDDVRLTALEKRKRVLEDQMDQQRIKIRQRAQEFGTDELTSRQEMMLGTVSTLQQELIAISIRRIMLETQLEMREEQLSSEVSMADVERQRQELIERDPLVRSLREDVTRYEEMVRIGQTTMQQNNPVLARRIEMLEDLKRQLEKRRSEVATSVEEQIQKEIQKAQVQDLQKAKIELQQTIVYEDRLRSKLEETDAETIGLGRKQFEIDDYTEQLDQTKRVYNDVVRRIEELNIERSRQPRISVGSYARSLEATGKQRKMALAAVFGGLTLGVLLGIFVDKLDKSLKGPGDMVKRVGVRIIGTTTCPEDVDKKLLPQQLMDDYQTICANITFLSEGEDTKIIAVTSPGMADGKTTFSINLAASFAKSGFKTLLIDGDLRKPDVATALKLPAEHHRGLQNYLFGMHVEKAAWKLDSMGLYILASDHRNASDALELLAHSNMKQMIRSLRDQYDKIVIDTPPVLAFADALVWAKASDGVVVTSFVDHTSKLEIREAIKRLEEVNVRILGTVVNNVKVAHSYRRYGYGYGYDYGKSSRKKQQERRKRNPETLLISEQSKGNTNQPDAIA